MNKIKLSQTPKQWGLKALLLTAFALFLGGIFTPIMTITQFIFLQNSFSIISGLSDLFNQQQYALFAIITLLSLCLPIAKICLLAWALHYSHLTTPLQSTIKLIHNYGRWAMLDVLVVAILLVSVKLGAIATVDIHMGLYWFAASVLITMFVTHKVSNMLDNKQKGL